MIRRPPRSTLFPYTNALPISPPDLRAEVLRLAARRERALGEEMLAQLSKSAEAADAARPGDTSQRVGLAHRLLEEGEDRKSTRLNSSHANISYAVFCLKKKKK